MGDEWEMSGGGISVGLREVREAVRLGWLHVWIENMVISLVADAFIVAADIRL